MSNVHYLTQTASFRQEVRAVVEKAVAAAMQNMTDDQVKKLMQEPLMDYQHCSERKAA